MKKSPKCKTDDELHLVGAPLTISTVSAVSQSRQKVSIPADPGLELRLARSVKSVETALQSGQSIYGVTTGFGGMADNHVDSDAAGRLQQNLLDFLAAGAGDRIDPVHTRGAMLLRANVLLQGKSGVRLELIDRLIRYLNEGLTPIVREHGSIGASGDLIPLSCIARAIVGNDRVQVIGSCGAVYRSQESLKHLNLSPIELRPKEGLALVNGTSFSAAIAANATHEAKKLLAISIASQSMMMRALLVQESPFDEFVHRAKPHPGQLWTARIVRQLLKDGCAPIDSEPTQVQDRYSLRCMPQYTGSIVEGIARIQETVETEMNAVSDNPLVDWESGKLYQSGNFLGQYIGIAMDDLRRFLGLLSKHLDVQIATLVAPEFNGGLSASLPGNSGLPFNMGLKGLQICGNSLMPMLTHLSSPLVEHFPTHAEQFNQNINGLSWGAANLAWKAVKLFQQYCAVSLIFCIQSLDLRAKQTAGHYDGRVLLGERNREIYEAVCSSVNIQPTDSAPYLYDDADRWLEQDIESLAGSLSDESKLSNAIQPILDSFNDSFLGAR